MRTDCTRLGCSTGDCEPSFCAAVSAPSGPLVVRAGPGAGKTTLLARRAIELVHTQGIAPETLRIVSFTNQAVLQFRSTLQVNLAVRLGVPLQELLSGAGAWADDAGSTIHQLAIHVLRTEGHSVRFCSEPQKLRWIRRAMQHVAELRLAKSAGAQPTPADLAQRFQSRRELDAYSAVVHAAYVEALDWHGYLDLEELIVRAADRAEADPELHARLRVEHLLLDEAQDLDPQQYRLLLALAGPEARITLVGDPDQAIFGWRGAAPELFDRFPSESGAAVHRLRRNRRSTTRIIAAANSVLGRGPAGEGAAFRGVAGTPVRVHRAADEQAEVAAVRAWFAECAPAADVPERSRAVLCRLNRTLVEVEYQLLLDPQAHYCVATPGFFGLPGVREVLAYARVVQLSNRPALYDATLHSALEVVLGCPRRGLRPADIGRLLDFPEGSELTFADLLQRFRATRLGSAARAQVDDLAEVLEKLAKLRRRVFRKGKSSKDNRLPGGLPTLARGIARDTGLRVTWELADGEGFEDPEQNFRRFQEVLRARFSGLDEQSLPELLALVARVRRYGADPGEDPLTATFSGSSSGAPEGNPLHLLTLHQAKGREFHAVAVLGVEESLLPHTAACKEGAVEEERRLLYVGMTRAKDHLGLFRAARRAGKIRRGSRFLRLLPEEVIERRDDTQPRKSPKASRSPKGGRALPRSPEAGGKRSSSEPAA